MLTVKELIDEWKADAVMNQLEPGNELYRIPTLHAKYNEQLTLHTLEVEKTKVSLARKTKLKWRYYSGKMPPEELDKYNWEPFQFVLKSDIHTYIDGDDDILEIKTKIVEHQEAAKFCESVMKELHSRTFQLKAYIDYEKFINGQG